MNNPYFYDPKEKPEWHLPLWALVTIIALMVALLTASACYIFLMPKPSSVPQTTTTRSTLTFSSNFYGMDLDITNMEREEIDDALLFCALNRYDKIIISTDNPADTESIIYTVQSAYNQGLSPYIMFNLAAASNGFAKGYDLNQATIYLKKLCVVDELSGIFFEGWDIFKPENSPFADLAFGYTIKDLCKIVRYTDAELFVGLYCEGTAAENTLPLAWTYDSLFDMLLIDGGGYMNGSSNSFEQNMSAWEKAVDRYAETIYMMRSSRAGSKFMGWDEPDQLLWQAVALNKDSGLQFCIDSYSAAATDPTETMNKLNNFLISLADNNYIISDMVFTSPSSQNSSTYSSVIVFAGASDPNHPLIMNGEEIKRDRLGHFEEVVELEPGTNKFTFIHKSREYTFSINYMSSVIALVYPNTTEYYDSGSTVSVSAVAKKGSTVTATIGNKTVTLKQETFYEESVDSFGEYYNFAGSITLPVLTADTDMGKIMFEGTLGGETFQKEGGTVAVYRKQPSDNSETPSFNLPEEDGYIDVGSKFVAEVVVDRAETFDTEYLNDYSKPTNSYLPKGTIDYCAESTDRLFGSEGEKLFYRTLRYGKRVYVTSERNGREIAIYESTLPETNNLEIAYFKEADRSTSLALKVDWKAPFRFEMGGQQYIDDDNGEARPYYTVNSMTCSYVDITFCYAENVLGNISISESNPLFSGYEWIQNEADWTLRLWLKKSGGLYGWNAEYDSEGRLVFDFLHPAKIVPADNIYGVSLENAVILLDPGHTGTIEKGATHNLFEKNEKYNITEAMANLALSIEIKRQLESLGATVHLTRGGNNLDSLLTLNQRLDMVSEYKPDLFLSIHHDYNKYASLNGFTSFYFTPMSWRLSQKIYNATESAGIYANHHGNLWHTLYVTRITDCPAVLTENGFMSNDNEYQNVITNASVTQKRAAATVKGIVDYFQSIQ